MNIPLQKWMTTALLTCISCGSIADDVVEPPRHVLGLNTGSTDTSGDFSSRTNGDTSQSAFDVSSDTSYAVAWGIENTKARVMLEYYVTETNIESLSPGNAELKTESIFYSGYWIPNIYWGIKGILGGGIGYSRHTLSNVALGNMKESDWSFKASAGVEYGVLRNLSIYALADLLFHSSVGDYVTPNATPPAVTQRTISGLEQSRLSFGVNFRY